MVRKNNFSINNNLPILYFDGGSRGNPGEAAGAGVILMPDGSKYSASKYLNFATNNEAEYTGLIIGLEKAKELGIKELTIQGDSNLVVNQIQGNWKVKSPNLQSYYHQASQLIKSFSYTNINWIPREQNKLADLEANKCMDKSSNSQVKNQEKIEYNQSLTSEILQFIKLGSKAKFQDYLNLKSGYDEYSKKGLRQLKQLISPQDQEKILKDWLGNDHYLAKVYRWYLRGLPPEMAIKKVEVEAEIEEKITGIHPWKHQEILEKISKPKLSDIYSQGDVVVINNFYPPENKKQGTIIEPPKQLKNGKWLITLEVDDYEL
jgi:ribonuclease HI